MEATVHSQFGTVDNPVLIFTSDSSWRIVICMGPGIEDDSHSHEKMFYLVREGPINRCQVCGQCFKVVRLKDEFSELQDYYHMMFATLSHFETAEEDLQINLTSYFGDRPQASMQTIPATNVYIHVNPDEADRILVDPAYKLERLKEAHERLYAMTEAYRIVDRQMEKHRTMLPLPYGRDQFETWYKVEKAIRKFDRLFNKVEKFDSRKFIDSDNHERRELRMLDRKKQRWTENYTYFFGGLSEEEQMYRDYFETDIEMDPEDEEYEDLIDARDIAEDGQLNPKLYDFIETSLEHEPHESFVEDIIEQKIFKYKYRQCADGLQTYDRRMARVMSRSNERASTRDPALEADLYDLYKEDEKDSSLAQLMLDHNDYKLTAQNATQSHREYMVNESLQQYRDYYESDNEEQQFFEYMDNLSNRDQIRFMEIFEDFSVAKVDMKDYAMIKKREFNPELSAFSNLLLDLVDFKDRVRPMARDIALMDVSRQYQKLKVDPEARQSFEALDQSDQSAVESVDEGYSSLEIQAQSTLEDDAAEPDMQAAAEENSKENKQE